MKRQQAREHINSRLPYELEKAEKIISGHDSYICPFCRNGSGEDGTGICTKDGQHYTCFKGCFSNLDYLDILKKKHATDREWDIFKLYDLTIDSGQSCMINRRGNARQSREIYATAQQVRPETPAVNYNQYFRECNARVGQTDYFYRRGISKKTIARFMLGYDPAWKHPNALNAPATERAIIPTGRESYFVRAIDQKVPEQFKKQKVGTSCLFNIKALQSTEYPFIFITEGEFDALSVIDVGGQAIALGSTSNASKLIEAVENIQPTATLVLSLDNDEAGQKVQAVLTERLETLKISFLEANISGAYKDPNEHLMNDRDGFAKIVKDPANRGDKKAEYIKANSVSSSLNTFMQTVTNAADIKAIPTGFNILDKVLDNGFYEGLYIIGAVSGIGKTSLCLQIADQIALHGKDVIFFSLEMSKYQLISKSLSRLTFIEDNGKNKNGFHYARTSRQITTGAIYSDREKQLVQVVSQRYHDYSQNLYIYEGMGNIGTEQIKLTVNEHFSCTGKRPVVIIDYLQILTPCDMKGTDKQNIDKSVLDLKRMSMEYQIPVLAVSSFNRDNYMNPVNMASFKESGAIEYSSDVLLGLQFKGMDGLSQNGRKNSDTMKIIEEWRRVDCRELELKILKNRNGASGDSIYFTYYPRFNYFQEVGKSENTGRIEP